MPPLHKPADLIYARGIVTAESIAAELRERLADQLTAPYMAFASEWDILERARNILREFEPILAETLLNVDLAAWIAGFDKVRKQMPDWAIDSLGAQNIFNIPPPMWRGTTIGDDGEEPTIRFPLLERAAANLFERRIVTRATFDRLTDAAKQRAFTVANDLGEATIEKIRDTLRESLIDGPSLADFRARLGPALQSSFIGPFHLETVYRTNIQAAYADGHEAIANNAIVEELFPYQAYLPIHDRRAREEHAALEFLGLNGTNIYRRDDPFWDLFTPPWDFNCRCGVNLLTIEAAARAGVQEAKRWLDSGKRPLVPEWRIDHIPFRPPPGFIGGRQRRAA